MALHIQEIPVGVANQMKKCDVENCPCCNVITWKYAKPKCWQIHLQCGTISHVALHWVCEICGCEWEHGEFKNKQTTED